jgi:DNA-binding transcriptional LysR family regulator
VAKSYPHRRLALRGLSTHDVLEAVLNGVGLAALPCVLESAQLVRLEMSPTATWSSIWVLTHREVRPSARVRALANFMTVALRVDRARIEGKRSPGARSLMKST